MVAIVCTSTNPETTEVLRILYDLEEADKWVFSIPVGCTGVVRIGDNILSDAFGDGLTVKYSANAKPTADIPYALYDALVEKESPIIQKTTPTKRRVNLPTSNMRTNDIEVQVLKSTDTIGLARDTPTKSKEFGTITPNDLHRIIHLNHHLYELVKPEGHVRLYFDLEWLSTPSDTPRFDTLLQYICDYVGTEHSPRVLTASRPQGDSYKHSYHIHFPTVVFESAKHLHCYVYHALESIYRDGNNDVLFWDNNGDSIPAIDWGVYSRWQNFRLPFQAGVNKPRVLTPVDATQEFVLDDYLININTRSPDYTITPVPDLPEHRHTMSRRVAQTIAGIISPPITHIRLNCSASATTHVRKLGGSRTPPPKNLSTPTGEEHFAKYLGMIPPDCDYNTWFMIACILKHNGASFALFNEWSSHGSNYGGHQKTRYMWDSIVRHSSPPSFASLVYYAKMYNPCLPEFQQPREQFDDFEQLKHDYEQTESTGDYLPDLPLYDDLPRVLYVQSGMGTGKSHQIKRIISEMSSESSVLIVSPRITYAHHIYGEYRDLGFVLYSSLEGAITQKRVICSPESIWRIQRSSFDLVVCDEVETILKSMTSSTNKTHFYDNITRWEQWLAHEDTKVFVGDAFITQRSIDYFDHFNGNKRLHIHHKHYTPKTILKFQNPDKFRQRFCELVLEGKRIYFVCNSKKQITDVYEPFLKENNISHIVYHRDVGSARKTTLQNANDEWTRVQVVITSPTITIGINQNTAYFDHRFVYTSSMSACPRDNLQALWRVRQTTTTTDFWCSHKRKNYTELKNQPTRFDALRTFLEEKHWATLPNVIVSSEHLRRLAIWNILEDNIKCVAHTEWFEYLLNKLNFHIENVPLEDDEIPTNISTNTYQWSCIPDIDVVGYTAICEAIRFGGVELTPEDLMAKRKFEFKDMFEAQLTDEDYEKVWDGIQKGRNMKQLRFLKKYINNATPHHTEQTDVFFNYSNVQYEFYKTLLDKLRWDKTTKMTVEPAVFDEANAFIESKLDYIKNVLRVRLRGEDTKKRMNKLLNTYGIVSLTSQRKRVNGELVYVSVMNAPAPSVLEGLQHPGEPDLVGE